MVPLEEIVDSPVDDRQKVGLTVWIAGMKEKFVAKSNLELTSHPHHLGTYDGDNFEKEEKCETFMGVPLVSGMERELIGVLKVETKMSGAEFAYFNEQDELVFELIADSAAIAIQNARLVEARTLTDNIVNRCPNNTQVFLALRQFVQNRLDVVSTLENTARQVAVDDEDPGEQKKRIVEMFTLLLRPDWRPLVLEELAKYQPNADMKLLLKLFSNSLKVKSLASIADLDTQKFEKETLGRAEDPEFELHVAARLLLSTLGKIQRLLVDYRGSTGEIKHLKVGIHAIESVGNKLDTVNLFERNVLRGIFAHWKQLLKREAEKWHDIENPYVAGLPLDASSRVFIGRGEVFDWIHKKLSGSDGKNVLVLHGGMRTGKTSILKQLAFGPLGHELRTRGQRPVFPVFVDLQKFADPGTWPLLFGLAEAIRDSLTNGPSSTQVPCPQPALDEFREVSYLAFDRFLDRVDEQVARKRNGLLAIMWDEFEKLDERVQSQKLDPEIFSYLRSKMQHQPSVTFILAGQHSLEDMTPRFRDIVFNVALHYQVGCLT